MASMFRPPGPNAHELCLPALHGVVGGVCVRMKTLNALISFVVTGPPKLSMIKAARVDNAVPKATIASTNRAKYFILMVSEGVLSNE